MHTNIARAACFLAAGILAACATATPPNTALIQAHSSYDALQQRGGEKRVDADMERAKAALDRADSSSLDAQGPEYVNAVSDIALHLTQAADAKERSIDARHAADSLRGARLARLLTLSESQRAELMAQNQLTQAEIEALRARNMNVTQREDSLRMETSVERNRGDSLRAVAMTAQHEADSLSAAAASATREQTFAERQRTDSLHLVATNATLLADSLRGVVRYGARARDSLRIATSAGALERSRADSLALVTAQVGRQADSARTAAERQRGDSFRATAERTATQLDSARRVADASSRERDSLRTAMTVAAHQSDSLRDAVASAARARDSLRVLNDQLSALERTTAGLREVHITDRGLVISLSGVLFDPGASRLTPASVRSMRRIAQVLQQYPSYQLSVEGHTDSIGKAASNQTLSESRANAVVAALTAGGVDGSRMTAKGFGDTQPVTTNKTVAGRQQNRRVEIVVLGAGAAGN